MARKKKRMDIGKELEKIEAEERVIEAEERQIERKEDVIRAFEELGLMRWKSYYILTAGAILLLALTFVTALWVMHGQLQDLQGSVDSLALEVQNLETGASAPAAQDWCPEGQSITLDMASVGGTGTAEIEIMGEEMRGEDVVCHGIITSDLGEGPEVVEIWWDQAGNIEVS